MSCVVDCMSVCIILCKSHTSVLNVLYWTAACPAQYQGLHQNTHATLYRCRWLPTTGAQVRAWVWSCEICGGQSGAGAGFLWVLRFPLPSPPIAPQSPSSSIMWGLYNRPVVATVPSGLNLTPLRIKKNNNNVNHALIHFNCYCQLFLTTQLIILLFQSTLYFSFMTTCVYHTYEVLPCSFGFVFWWEPVVAKTCKGFILH
jgi:hypothetical protein